MRKGAILAGAAVAACAPPPTGENRSQPAQSGAERGYAPPPAVIEAARAAGGRILLSGMAQPASRVRLASPAGEATFAVTDASGVWTMNLPESDVVRIFGLSAPVGGRVVQAEGYLAVTPRGEAVQLRGGAGALALGRPGAGVALLTADFDHKGGAVLSGYAPVGAQVMIAVDGQDRGPANADASGRFTLALNKPLDPGAHVIAVTAQGARQERSLSVSSADPLAGGPFRAEGVDGGWRIDWLAPGGGVQSTVVFEPSGVLR